jgi:hypothetical protein
MPPKRNFNNQSSQGPVQATGDNVTTQETLIPMLRYGPGNNYFRFMEACKSRAGSKFGDLARIFDDLSADYWEPPVLVAPTAAETAEDVDPNHYVRILHIEKMKLRARKIDSMENNRTALFEMIMANICQESRAKVEQALDWEEIQTQRDPLRTLRQIHATHASGQIFSGDTSRAAAMLKFSKLQMTNNEHISSFYKRFLEAIKGIRSTDDTTSVGRPPVMPPSNVPSQQMQASTFA